MIWGYHYFRKLPYDPLENDLNSPHTIHAMTKVEAIQWISSYKNIKTWGAIWITYTTVDPFFSWKTHIHTLFSQPHVQKVLQSFKSPRVLPNSSSTTRCCFTALTALPTDQATITESIWSSEKSCHSSGSSSSKSHHESSKAPTFTSLEDWIPRKKPPYIYI